MRDDGQVQIISKKKIITTGDSTINLVYILDISSSMNEAGRIDAAKLSIKEELKVEEKGIKYLYSLVTFSYASSIKTRFWKTSNKNSILSEVNDVDAAGMTALNKAVVDTVNRVIESSTDGQKYIVSILTDGGENNSGSHYRSILVKETIQRAEKLGITINFIGQKEDTDYAVQNYGISFNNTMSYDGSGADMLVATSMRTEAIRRYSKSVASGQQVKTDEFFVNK